MSNSHDYDPEDHHEQDDDDDEASQPSDTGLSGPLGPLDPRWSTLIGSPTGSLNPPTRIPRGPIPPPAPSSQSAAPPPAAADQRGAPEQSLFTQRYQADRRSMPPAAGSPQMPPAGAPWEGAPRKPPRGHLDDHFAAALQQRRGEDERATGRHWPGNGLTYPGDPHEAELFFRMGVALGELSPHTIAHEAAMRYVRASRVSGEDDLGPTDIYSIVYYGLGLTLRPLDCTGLPHVLAVYHRATREIYLDWKLLQDPPFGRASFDPSAWRRAVDGEQIARFLLAWCAAVHLTDTYDIPLVLGFAPAVPGAYPGSIAPPSGDTLNRYRKAMEATATLLAPAERLWQQIHSRQVGIRMGDQNWRDALRADYRQGYGPGGRASNGPATAGPGGAPHDPVELLLTMLAEYNNCPPVLVESQLDGVTAHPDWMPWSQRLIREIPIVQMRFVASSRMFTMASANANALWGATAPISDGARQVPAQLSL